MMMSATHSSTSNAQFLRRIPLEIFVIIRLTRLAISAGLLIGGEVRQVDPAVVFGDARLIFVVDEQRQRSGLAWLLPRGTCQTGGQSERFVLQCSTGAGVRAA